MVIIGGRMNDLMNFVFSKKVLWIIQAKLKISKESQTDEKNIFAQNFITNLLILF